jgi:hypothetical protein
MIVRTVATAIVLGAALLNSFDSSADPTVTTDEDLVKVDVDALLMNEEDRSVLLVLKPGGEAEAKRVLPLVIGFEEGRSIFIAFRKITAPRPMSHDLMKKIIEEYGGSVVRCVITKMEGETFYADLRLKRGGREFSMDSRPSDAVALALRSNAPVFVRKEVMERHGVDPSKPAKTEKPLKT